MSHLLRALLLIVAVAGTISRSHALAVTTTTVSEGSLQNFKVASTLAAAPGSGSGFYSAQRRAGRDFVVLSVAHWIQQRQHQHTHHPPRLLDAMCASGVQGLRVAVESPLLADAYRREYSLTHSSSSTTRQELQLLQEGEQNTGHLPELQVVLNDMNHDALNLAKANAAACCRKLETNKSTQTWTSQKNSPTIQTTQRIAQSLLYEASFEITVLDPFGSVTPFLDAALARAPHGSLVEICATDVGALYGSRPAIARRHYSAAHLQPQRPPCFRERGIRLLLAAVAQAAGRHDRGMVPVWTVSTQHVCLASVRVLRRGNASDVTLQQVQSVRICKVCGHAGGVGRPTEKPQCCCEPKDGAGTDAVDEGPFWVGSLFDADTVHAMTRMAFLDEARGLISDKTRNLLTILDEEASVDAMSYRRPGVASPDRTPKIALVKDELAKRGYKTARTHFDPKALRSTATANEFDAVVKEVVARSVNHV